MATVAVNNQAKEVLEKVRFDLSTSSRIATFSDAIILMGKMYEESMTRKES